MAKKDLMFPLSFAQRRLWLLAQMEPGSSLNISRAFRMSGALNIEALQQALEAIVTRHEALRTTFATIEGQPVQIISPPEPFSLSVVDLRGLARTEGETEVRRVATEEAQQAFRLTRGPLWRTTLLRLDAEEHILLLTMHHIISDDWSFNVFMQELIALYETFSTGQPPSLPELPIRYTDFVHWQQQRLQGEALEAPLSYWKQQLAGNPPMLQLPTDWPRVATRTFRSERQSLVLPQTLTEALKALSNQADVALFVTLLAAFKTLLYCYTGQEDIIVGSSITNRDRMETEALIGCFVSTLVLRVDLSGNPTFRELLRRVREVVLGAYAHQDLPFERLVEELWSERDLNRNPLFDIMVNFRTALQTAWELSGLALSVLELTKPESNISMTLCMEEQEHGLSLQLVYQCALFTPERVACLMDQFRYLLEQVVAAPEKPIRSYSLVTPESRSWLPDPSAVLPQPRYELVTNMFDSWASRTPGQTAVRQGDHTWTYGELAASAHTLVGALLAHGLERGDVVAVFGPRSFGLIVGMIAVLSSGGVLLTIDQNLPSKRQQLMLREAGTKYLLHVGGRRLDDKWLSEFSSLVIIDVNADTGLAIEPEIVQDLEAIHLPELGPDDAAYLFFTSGTTGIPKGVLGCHKGLSHFLAWQQETFAIGPQDRSAQLTALSFDVVLRDIFLPLTSGATLCLPEDVGDLGPDRIFPWLERERISLLHIVPALAESWLVNVPPGVRLHTLRWAFFAGEPLTEALVHRWREAFPEAGEIVNLYGPTETTLAKCFYRVPSDILPGVQPVGSPLPQTQALILAENNRLCGIGEPGEIVLRTPFRSLGYINAPEENRNRFVKNPFRDDEGDLLYYTGDRGLYRPDGSLEILGRLDHQVKIRGVRVEPDEVAATLSGHPGVKSCIVVSRENERGQNSLIAYVVAAKQGRVTISKLRSHLSKRLPAVMIPSAFIFLEQWPLTPNGKVDRQALPAPDRGLDLEGTFVAPRTRTEEALAEIYAEVLGLNRVGVQSNFFELGGQSLMAMQVIARVRQTFQAELPLNCLFEAPTVADLAKVIIQREIEQADSNLLAQTLAYLEQLSEQEAQTLLAAEKQLSDGQDSKPGFSPSEKTGYKTRKMDELLERANNLSPERQELLALRLRKKRATVPQKQSIPRIPPLRPISRNRELPVSFIQERWLLRAQEQPSMILHSGGALCLTGPLNIAALEQSLSEVVRRHEALRTTFSNVEGRWVQFISPARHLTLRLVDLREFPKAEREPQIRRLATEDALRPFDRSKDILLRATLLLLGEEEHSLLLWIDHVASDGWSLKVLSREVSVLYKAFSTGAPSSLPELPIQYADFAYWQRQWLQGEALEALLSYWKKQFGNHLPELALPTDYHQPAVKSYRGARQKLVLPATLSEALKALSYREGVTLFITLLAAFQTLLHRYTGQDDIAVLSPTAYRTSLEIEALIGVFAHGIVLRTDLSGNPSFRELLGRVREKSLETYSYLGLPFGVLVKTLQAKFNLRPTLSPRVFFSLEENALQELELPDLGVNYQEIDIGISFTDLSLRIVEGAEGLTAIMSYRTALFAVTTISRMLRHFHTLLESIVADPQQRLLTLKFS